jgi:glycosyltransferase involved in cell wall biosynthesis
MTTIAITIIGHNEAHLLPAALESVKWADEIIYVDCESTDGSVDLARRYTDQVFSHPNDALIVDKRNFSFAQAGTEWVFYLDPDEALSAALGAEIRAMIASVPPENGFRLPRRNHFFGRWLRHGRQYPDTQLRLFRRGKAHFPPVVLHERLEVEGSVGELREPMDHYTSATVLDSLEKLELYTTIHAQEMAQKGMAPSAGLALKYMLAKPLGRFTRRYFLAGGFRDGWPGFIQACIGAIEWQFRFIKFWHYATRQGQAGRAEKPGSSQ